RGGAPDRQDAGDELDPARARRRLGEQEGRVQPPALGKGEGLVAELVRELGRAQDDVVPGLHGRERHATSSGAHSRSSITWLQILAVMLRSAGPAVRRESTPAGTSAGYLSHP